MSTEKPIYTYNLYGAVASKKNGKQWIKRAGKRYLVPSDFHAAWHEEAGYQLKVQRRPKEPLESARIVLTFRAPDMKLADLTNKTESVMDLLVDHAVLKDDNWFICGDIHLKFGGVESKNPGVVIEIYEKTL